MPSRFILFFSALLISFSVTAVEVIDRYPDGEERQSQRQPQAVTQAPMPAQSPAEATNLAELYYQLQVVQQEVLQLRGQVEEQAHQIKKLKQQRLDDYIDLDRRLSQLGQPGSGRPVLSSSTDSQTSNSSTASGGAQASELQSYRSAIDLVLKQQKYDQAADALMQHLKDYPSGRYAANAQYWLGEIYLLKNELETARQWFTKLLSTYPDHNKVPDAQFKLGKVHHLLGDDAKAKEFLNKAASSNSSAASLARDYLKLNFPS
ncbi:tol-pal system protein YbgF [Teredinibacter sp. KSP-S5-2]|uniref:tol-pal system protein YbgF n=1 Tax=Teredinibacter sp. KSP-S5-2 TaxID=3034506 RepID=UPI002934C4FD|nr:tol-pal system protein YbgF [Teredinibacter sp. KSP-S5-2]WNO08108.1 tol-pal system protein YbgF [Teredinibacter sp. KSP-S5-2]